jgi:putative transposase
MARKMRVEYEGAIYHVMSRGDRQEAIFKDDKDRARFIDTLGETCLKTEWVIHAWCLMGNHFHLVIETPQANLSEGMKWFLGTYTGRFNRRHKLFGPLFSGRFKSLVVDGSSDRYFQTVCDYVHLNPVRAKLLRPDQALREFQWSSFTEYLKPQRKRVAWLRVTRLMGELGIPKDSTAGRRKFERLGEERRAANDQKDFKSIRRGWVFGDRAFRKELMAQMSETMGPEHYGQQRRESQGEKAEGIVVEEFRRLKWKESQLDSRAKGDPGKVRIALRLRTETTVTFGWISKRLKMGSRSYAQNLVYAQKKRELCQ